MALLDILEPQVPTLEFRVWEAWACSTRSEGLPPQTHEVIVYGDGLASGLGLRGLGCGQN